MVLGVLLTYLILSVVVESLIVAGFFIRRGAGNVWKAVLSANLVTYGILALLALCNP